MLKQTKQLQNYTMAIGETNVSLGFPSIYIHPFPASLCNQSLGLFWYGKLLHWVYFWRSGKLARILIARTFGSKTHSKITLLWQVQDFSTTFNLSPSENPAAGLVLLLLVRVWAGVEVVIIVIITVVRQVSCFVVHGPVLIQTFLLTRTQGTDRKITTTTLDNGPRTRPLLDPY